MTREFANFRRFIPLIVTVVFPIPLFVILSRAGGVFQSGMERIGMVYAFLVLFVFFLCCLSMLFPVGKPGRGGKYGKLKKMGIAGLAIRVLIAAFLGSGLYYEVHSSVPESLHRRVLHISEKIEEGAPVFKTDQTEDAAKIIPIGVTRYDELTEEVLNVLHFPNWQDLSYDRPWGNDLKFVAEMRGEALWMGVYLDGIDGISGSQGNDPDDLNSWGQNGAAFYIALREKEEADRRRENAVVRWVCGSMGSLSLLFCLLYSFRSREPMAAEGEEMTEGESVEQVG